MQTRALFGAAAVLALALACAACGSGTPVVPGSPPPTATTRPASTATLTIVTPTPGQTVSTKGATVKIKLEGARIVQQVTTNIRPDEGHVHLRVDGSTITLFGGLETSTGALKAGSHLIEVEFVAADHGPFNPRVIQQVTVTAA